MIERSASCSCGQLQLVCRGEPSRVSMCHCLECQRRTGAVLSNQAWFAHEQVSTVEGRTSEYVRISDDGQAVRFRFCPVCGSTVFWEAEARPSLIAVAVGTFADPGFPAPKHSVREKRQHRWLTMLADLQIQHAE